MARTGYSTVTAGSDRKTVADTNVQATSQLVVTLSGDPSAKAGGAVISHIAKSAGVGFTVYFTNPVYSDIEFDYSIL